MLKKITLYFFIALFCLEITLHLASWSMRFLTDSSIENLESSSNSKQIYKIMVLGESTSYGLLLKDRLKDAYPYKLAKLLGKNRKNIQFHIMNLSYPGQTSDSVLNVFEENFHRYKPNLVISQFGANDTNAALNLLLNMKIFGIPVPASLKKVKIFKFLLLKYLYIKEQKHLINKGEDGHFLFYNPKFKGIKSNSQYFNETFNNYQKIIDVTKQYNTPFVMLTYFTAPPETYNLLWQMQKKNEVHYIDLRLTPRERAAGLYSEDNWHPNEKGHNLIALKLAYFIKSYTNYFFKGF
jgi:lysophospholipase L1-like esterase